MLDGLFSRFRRPDWKRLAHAPSEGQRVCGLAELQDGRPKYVQLGAGGDFLCFVILRDAVPRAFRANCPHRDRPMGTAGQNALYADDEISCQHHGAVFRVHNGRCSGGPCKGERLCPVDVHCDGNWVVVGRAR